MPYLGEFIGTALLILLGDGICANVNLNKSGFKGAGPIFITIGWGLAVMIPVMIFGAATGAHFSPVFTIAFAIQGTFPWELVPGYIVCQMLGGFFGALIVYFLYQKHFFATEDAIIKRMCFCTKPAIKSWPHNFLSEIVATCVLVFAVKGFSQTTGLWAPGVDRVLIMGLICAMGMSFGGLTGYALNPARDLGPRIVHALMPMGETKADSDWLFGLTVPIIGPIVGGILGILLFMAIPW